MSRRGHSLIELIAALCIAAILFSVAIPTYLQYLQRTRRTEAHNILQKIAVAQERFYIQHNIYAATAESPAPAGLGINTGALMHYSISFAPHRAGWQYGFTAVATAKPDSPQFGDATCRIFSINEQGLRRAESSNNQDKSSACW